MSGIWIAVLAGMVFVGVYGLFRLCVGSPEEVVTPRSTTQGEGSAQQAADPYESWRENAERNLYPRSGPGNMYGPMSNNGLFDD